MSTARLQKEQDAEVLRQELAEIPNAILVDFQGLDVAAATDLRRKLRDGDARFRVVKNSIALRAIEDSPLAGLSDAFVGQTAIAYTDGDIVGVAKTLREFAKELETPNFKAGIVDGVPISAEEFEQLAKLPPRDELLAKMLYLMNYPITGLATALNGILRGFVTVLDQIREQKVEAGEDVPAEVVAPEPEAAEAAEPEAAEPEAVAEVAGDGETEDVAEPAGDGEAAEPEAAAEAAGDGEAEEVAEAAGDGDAEEAAGDAAEVAEAADEPEQAASADEVEPQEETPSADAADAGDEAENKEE